jgi:hypothetical protein
MKTDKPLETPLDERDLELMIEAAAAKARDSFPAFRRLMHPRTLRGWWIDEVDENLQQFYADLAAGRRPKLALMAPPQIGKSSAATDFIAWVAGKNPDAKTIFASYGEDLGVRTNGEIQRMLKQPRYAIAFAGTKIGLPGWQCNANLIEYANHVGSFRNTTVQGAVTGLQLNLGVIDDPVKGRQEINLRSNRDRIWNWFTDDFCTRFAADAGLLVIMTRWHVDDLLGRALKKFSDFKVLRYPAIAECENRTAKKERRCFPSSSLWIFCGSKKRP